MSNVWERFDGIASPDEVKDAQKRFEPIQAGDYPCILTELNPDENKDHLPMLKGKFKMIDGGRTIFYNQNLQNLNYPDMTKTNIADAVSFVDAIQGEEIPFTGLKDFADRVSGLQMGGEYTVNVSYGKKDLECKYPKLRIVGRAEDQAPAEEPLPFDI